jgi:mannose-6-phosphate isomerase
VQVHPDDAQAAARGLAGGKEECWVVTDAVPDARLGIGTLRPLTPEALRAAALSGEIESLLDWKPVVAGDWFHIAPGTVHAIGAGVTLVEIQQFADVTYRLFDYGRPRALHLDDAVAVSRAEPYQDPRHGRLGPAGTPKQLLVCPSFALYHGGGATLGQLPDTDLLLVPIAGQVDLADGPAAAGSVLFGRVTDAMVSDDFAYLAAVATAGSR